MFTVEVAHQLHKPIIFDPVGCGATKLRRDTALGILPKANIVRGNASEIMTLVQNKKMRGVEASHTAEEAIVDGIKLSQQYETTVVVSGATDIIINADYYKSVSGGSALMKVVTGMGCALTATIAAFHAVEKDTFKAAYAAVNYYAGCGQSAATQANSLGSFKVAFLDALFNLKTAVDSRRYCTTS
jgi:hydroxyethylthiazole kinase